MGSNDGVSRSWFCVFNNPAEHGYVGRSEQEILDDLLTIWMDDSPTRSCALTYCVSAEGMPHVHAVFEDTKTMRFSLIKKLFPTMHIERTKGTKDEAEDYINKVGKFEEKGEKVICSAHHGEIKGAQGNRRDYEIIEQLVEQGKTPSEIEAESFGFRRYDTMIRKAYFDKRRKETPSKRDIKVVWHVGESGSGKSYSQLDLYEKYGRDNVYLMTDYEGGGLDKYCGETILFMDEFRGQIKYNQLLIMLDGYLSQVHARYTNIYALWNEVHITSVLPPEEVYSQMVESNRHYDTFAQLRRRITSIVYHWKDSDGYHSFELEMKDYIDHQVLKEIALNLVDV